MQMMSKVPVTTFSLCSQTSSSDIRLLTVYVHLANFFLKATKMAKCGFYLCIYVAILLQIKYYVFRPRKKVSFCLDMGCAFFGVPIRLHTN